MNQELKARWLEALRSGKYPQGRACLQDEDGKFCCLGVLCVVQEWPTKHMNGAHIELLNDTQLTEAGMDFGEQKTLTRLNDGVLYDQGDGSVIHESHSFTEIANYIEANL